MSQIFHRSSNIYSRLSILAIAVVAAGLGGAVGLLQLSGYNTNQGEFVEQPIQFSHAHHVGGIGIDCRYCHSSVEESAFANIPPTKTCMNCHSQIWNTAPILEPVRASFRDNTPLQWNRVNDLPDFVYFNHSIHVKKGIGCATCHGPVDKMPLMYQESTLQMSWCLDCHRNPAKYIRPREEVFNMNWQRPANDPGLGERLVKDYKIASVEQLTSCSTCHR
ncbi:MAG: cytochrome c3 family protein [Actinobacteria bacterium]|nr:cytochrome c3 family protein [Actinomycetota bacterium]